MCGRNMHFVWWNVELALQRSLQPNADLVVLGKCMLGMEIIGMRACLSMCAQTCVWTYHTSLWASASLFCTATHVSQCAGEIVKRSLCGSLFDRMERPPPAQIVARLRIVGRARLAPQLAPQSATATGERPAPAPTPQETRWVAFALIVKGVRG